MFILALILIVFNTYDEMSITYRVVTLQKQRRINALFLDNFSFHGKTRCNVNVFLLFDQLHTTECDVLQPGLIVGQCLSKQNGSSTVLDGK
jgi:hypothetical protein